MGHDRPVLAHAGFLHVMQQRGVAQTPPAQGWAQRVAIAAAVAALNRFRQCQRQRCHPLRMGSTRRITQFQCFQKGHDFPIFFSCLGRAVRTNWADCPLTL